MPVVQTLLVGSPETAAVKLEDCPDLDFRETARLLCVLHVPLETQRDSVNTSVSIYRVQDLA